MAVNELLHLIILYDNALYETYDRNDRNISLKKKVRKYENLYLSTRLNFKMKVDGWSE